MDIKRENKDSLTQANGEFVCIYGEEEIFQAGLNLLTLKKGKYYLSPNLGHQITAEVLSDLKQTELLVNEALYPIDGLSAVLTEIQDNIIKGIFKYGSNTLEFEVEINADL